MKFEVVNLSLHIDDKVIYKNINFSVEENGIIGLVGRNGVGKTSFFKTVVGIYNFSEGNVFIDSSSVFDTTELLNNIIYVPDRFDYFNGYSIGKIVKFYKIAYDRFDEVKFYSMLKDIGLSFEKTDKIDSFSKGELTLVSILLAKATNAKIILIDEPFDGVDVINKKKLTKLLLEDEETIFVVSSHRLEELQRICNKVIYMDKNESSVIDVENDNYLNKVQVVFKEDIPYVLKNNSKIKIINVIGRVAVFISSEDRRILEQLLDIDEVIQYDFLNIKLEDVFVLKNGEDNVY